MNHDTQTPSPGPARPWLSLLFPAALALLLGLGALPGAADDEATAEVEPEKEATAKDAEIVAWRERYLALGKDVYEWACAACHAEGKNGAPRIGDRDAWSERSPLWSAVLVEHARQGFLDMPAKGGHAYLSDRAVTAAGEYMLGETFPEKPRD